VLPELDNVPIVYTGTMFVWFGILLGVGVQRWRGRWDRGACPVGSDTRRRWMLAAHERAIAATAGTLALIVASVVAAGADQLQLGVAIPYLFVHVLATGVVMAHALGDERVVHAASDDRRSMT
jgi:hypothetical protein